MILFKKIGSLAIAISVSSGSIYLSIENSAPGISIVGITLIYALYKGKILYRYKKKIFGTRISNKLKIAALEKRIIDLELRDM